MGMFLPLQERIAKSRIERKVKQDLRDQIEAVKVEYTPDWLNILAKFAVSMLSIMVIFLEKPSKLTFIALAVFFATTLFDIAESYNLVLKSNRKRRFAVALYIFIYIFFIGSNIISVITAQMYDTGYLIEGPIKSPQFLIDAFSWMHPGGKVEYTFYEALCLLIAAIPTPLKLLALSSKRDKLIKDLINHELDSPILPHGKSN